ncbi:hypothetical protein ACFP1I_22850 [Dyadobacter subterraneus]|uniref:Transposase n=1 Tax=Dyadobacter subterraneus TaxID=2773304 RepID=A0ABR9WIT0_9BACT|nr:hypothetical protein [Dyadobacter subterraneus]MBE9465395.1 hypothetical protein [Dyadobacter subterraneus]
MKNRFILSLSLVSVLFLSACGGKKEAEEEKEKEAPANAVEALQQFANKAKTMHNKEAVDPVDFRKLKELLPEKAEGLNRTEATGEKNGAMGFTISQAEARYSGDGDASAHVEIFDTGGVAGISTMALAAWSMADIDKETATGYEKTTKREGYKGYEKYDNQNKSGELNVLVADRFVVNVNGNNLSVDQLKSILGAIDLDKLSGLK